MIMFWNRKKLYYTCSTPQQARVQAMLQEYHIPFIIRNKKSHSSSSLASSGQTSGCTFYVCKKDYTQASFLMRKMI